MWLIRSIVDEDFWTWKLCAGSLGVTWIFASYPVQALPVYLQLTLAKGFPVDLLWITLSAAACLLSGPVVTSRLSPFGPIVNAAIFSSMCCGCRPDEQMAGWRVPKPPAVWGEVAAFVLAGRVLCALALGQKKWEIVLRHHRPLCSLFMPIPQQIIH